MEIIHNIFYPLIFKALLMNGILNQLNQYVNEGFIFFLFFSLSSNEQNLEFLVFSEEQWVEN